MRHLSLPSLVLPLVLMLSACTPQGDATSKSGGNALSGTDHRPGFFDLHVNTSSNRVLAKLPKADEGGVMLRFIHSARLTAGLGSNPVGLDRGWGEGGRIVTLRRMGDKIIMEEENLRYRANPENPLEARAVRESFARSFMASLPIIDDAADGPIVDLTPFLEADSLNLVQYLKDADQGSFKIQSDRTFVDTAQTLAFPDNIEIDVFFTLSSADAGREFSTRNPLRAALPPRARCKTNSGDPDDPVQLALARIRQLSAHEVGHALGFAHNFAGSSDGKSTVMDYPAPDVRLIKGKLDVSQAYGVGIGAWDKVSAAWLYGETTAAERDALLDAAAEESLTFVGDLDGRSAGTAHPDASVWDNGDDPVASLENVMAVRAYALERFGPDNLPEGRPPSAARRAVGGIPSPRFR